MSGSPKPPSRLIAVKASPGLVRTMTRVSTNALKKPRSCRFSQGSPLRGAVVSDVEPAPICAGGAAGATAPNSGNCESGCQVAIPSRHPISVGAKRPVRRPSRTSSSENTPKLVAPRLTWIMAIIAVLVNRCGRRKLNARLDRGSLVEAVTFRLSC